MDLDEHLVEVPRITELTLPALDLRLTGLTQDLLVAKLQAGDWGESHGTRMLRAREPRFEPSGIGGCWK